MTKRETIKFIVQMIASIATAIVTALGATSCMGMYKSKRPLLWIEWRLLLLMSQGEVNPESWTQLDGLHRLGYLEVVLYIIGSVDGVHRRFH